MEDCFGSSSRYAPLVTRIPENAGRGLYRVVVPSSAADDVLTERTRDDTGTRAATTRPARRGNLKRYTGFAGKRE
jgi:hypothetical protein